MMTEEIYDIISMYPSHDIKVVIQDAAGNTIEKKIHESTQYSYDKIVTRGNIDEIISESNKMILNGSNPDEIIKTCIYFGRNDLAIKVIREFGPGNTIQYIFKNAPCPVFFEATSKDPTISFNDLVRVGLYIKVDPREKLEWLSREIRMSGESLVEIIFKLYEEHASDVKLVQSKFATMTSYLFEEFDYIELMSTKSYAGLATIIARNSPKSRVLPVLHQSILLKEYIMFSVIINGIHLDLTDRDILNVFNKILLSGSSEIYVKFIKCIGMRKIGSIVKGSKSLSEAFAEYAKYGDAKIFKDMIQFWRDLINTSCDIHVFANNAAYHGKLELLEYIEEYVRATRNDLMLRPMTIGSLYSLIRSAGRQANLQNVITFAEEKISQKNKVYL